jgi:hypothetical protein
MKSNLKRFYIKVQGLFARTMRAFLLLPMRFYRIVVHFVAGIRALAKRQGKIQHWWQDFAFLLLDLLAVPEVYETTADFLKWDTRPLSPSERKLAASVFGDALKLDQIRLDNKALIGCKKRNIVYVSFFTVNSWGKIHPTTFIHELVHIWQYQKLGAAYMTQALRAQHTKEGYNYGGVNRLREGMELKTKLTDFNLEQQADIIADYYAIREGLKPTWGKGTQADLPVYQYFIAQIRAAEA